jgi:ribosomal protein S18 acetylase RimI-like enzyme
MTILRLTSAEAERRLPELAEILADAVAGGASVNFMAPFTAADALGYWRGQLPAIAAGDSLLFAAIDGDRAVGTVRLDFCRIPNQPHRADVAKMLVHRHARRRGHARALMEALEDAARAAGRTLLTLDTASAEAEALYESLGYIKAGVIPDYAKLPGGAFCDTTLYYKRLL